MRVIDSSVWVEILADTALATHLMAEIPDDQAQIVMPTIVVLEVCRRIMRTGDAEAENRFLAYASQCVEAPLDTRMAVKAAEMHRTHKLATADAIVYATAQMHNAQLVTCDAHFDGLESVIYIANTG